MWQQGHYMGGPDSGIHSGAQTQAPSLTGKDFTHASRLVNHCLKFNFPICDTAFSMHLFFRLYVPIGALVLYLILMFLMTVLNLISETYSLNVNT